MNRTATSHIRRFAAALATTTVVTLGVAGAANAETSSPITESTVALPSRLEVAKAKCTQMIDKRLRSIEVLKGRLANPSVTDAHRIALTTALNDAATGLGNLKPQIAAATDKATLKPLCDSIVVDYRIYLFRTPQVAAVVGLDVEAANLNHLSTKATDLQSQIDAKKAAGKDTARAEQSLAKMNTEIAAAHASNDGVADTVMGYSVSQWNANHSLLRPAAKAVVETHRHNVKAAAFGAKTQRILNRL